MRQTITQYVMVALLVVGAYEIGAYKTKVDYLEKGVPTAQVAGDTTAQPTKPTTVDLAKVKDLFDGKHITFGDKDAKVIITEISDPSCPYCHIAGGKHPELNNTSPQFKMVADGGTYVAPGPEIEKMVKEGSASYIFLYAPGHGSGEVGTQALYCAYDQGKFWEAKNMLMTKTGYDLLNDVVKNDLAQSSKIVALLKSAVNGKDLQDCLDSKKYEAQPANDTAFVQSLGFGATPTFFVNNKVIEGAQPWSAFKPTVDELI